MNEKEHFSENVGTFEVINIVAVIEACSSLVRNSSLLAILERFSLRPTGSSVNSILTL